MVSKLELYQVALVIKQKSGNLGTMAGIGRRWRKYPLSKDGIMVIAGILLCLPLPISHTWQESGVCWMDENLTFSSVPALLIRNCDIFTERAWVHTGVPQAVAECHLEFVTEQIIITLQAFSFILVYARRRLTPSSSSSTPHTTLKERKKEEKKNTH